MVEELDAALDDFTARMEIIIISINSKPPNSHPGTKDKADDSALSRPLSEDVLTVSVSRPDGSIARRDVQLGDSMQKMAKLIDDTEEKVARLKQKLHEVNEDISGVLSEYNKATKLVCKVHEGKRAAFLSDVHAFHASALENIVEARMEDSKHSAEAKKKLQAFMASLV